MNEELMSEELKKTADDFMASTPNEGVQQQLFIIDGKEWLLSRLGSKIVYATDWEGKLETVKKVCQKRLEDAVNQKQ